MTGNTSVIDKFGLFIYLVSVRETVHPGELRAISVKRCRKELIVDMGHGWISVRKESIPSVREDFLIKFNGLPTPSHPPAPRASHLGTRIRLGLWIWGRKTSTGSPHRIKHKNKETAVLGGNVTIFCNLTTSADVVQITWQKVQDSLPQNIGTYSSKYGEKILPPYIDRLHCKVIEPNSSFITIREVTFEDEACYKCLFNVFPHGSQEGQICLTIITVSELKSELQFNLGSEDFLKYTYSAVGKPVPQISLFPSQVLINPPKEYLAQNADGTVTITKMYNVSLETVRSLGLQHLIVHMDHPLRNEEKIVPLSFTQECTSGFSYMWLATVLPVIFLCIIILYIVRRKKKWKGRKRERNMDVREKHRSTAFCMCCIQGSNTQPVHETPPGWNKRSLSS
ncbi:OX-2 membrane glycoprotein [Myotis lucifugus]|uniref:OX-2 membrane glycoprotein n=1 Tax=Myotis lucifugus TaxID=59463 RepID=UPI000CCC3600|nr:OX-2 membrane glycoprotein [Myotis lucifugus]